MIKSALFASKQVNYPSFLNDFYAEKRAHGISIILRIIAVVAVVSAGMLLLLWLPLLT